MEDQEGKGAGRPHPMEGQEGRGQGDLTQWRARRRRGQDHPLASTLASHTYYLAHHRITAGSIAVTHGNCDLWHT